MKCTGGVLWVLAMCTAICTAPQSFPPGDVNTVRARAARGTLHQSSLAASRAGGAARVGSYYRLKIRVNLPVKLKLRRRRLLRGPAAAHRPMRRPAQLAEPPACSLFWVVRMPVAVNLPQRAPRGPDTSAPLLPVQVIGQDSGRVLTRTLGEYFSGGDPVSLSQIDHHGPLLTYTSATPTSRASPTRTSDHPRPC
jgi:hypothetical protein